MSRLRFITLALLIACQSVGAQTARRPNDPPKTRGQSGWNNIAPHSGLFKVAVPGEPKVVARQYVPLAGANLPIYAFEVRARGGLFVVRYSDDPPGNKVLNMEPEPILEAVRQSYVEVFFGQYAGAKITAEKEVQTPGWVVRDYVIEGGNLRGRARVAVNRERFILLMSAMPEGTWEESFENFFFDSLKLPKPKKKRTPQAVAAAMVLLPPGVGTI